MFEMIFQLKKMVVHEFGNAVLTVGLPHKCWISPDMRIHMDPDELRGVLSLGYPMQIKISFSESEDQEFGVKGDRIKVMEVRRVTTESSWDKDEEKAPTVSYIYSVAGRNFDTDLAIDGEIRTGEELPLKPYTYYDFTLEQVTDRQVFEGVVNEDNSGNGSYYSWHTLVQDDGEVLKLLEMTEKLVGKRVRVTVEELIGEEKE